MDTEGYEANCLDILSKKKITEEEIDEALIESFPASDPPAWTLGLDDTNPTSQVGLQTIYTIGHSTHPIDEFLMMLKSYDIKQLIDIRTIPKSRYNPQYNQMTLSQTLSHQCISYIHMPGLGGLRKPQKESINQGWRNSSFRGYADYMQTTHFKESLEELITTAARKKTAIMCAEAVPWRCHRSLIADALICKGWQVIDIMDAHHGKTHILHPMAKIQEGKIYYPKS